MNIYTGRSTGSIRRIAAVSLSLATCAAADMATTPRATDDSKPLSIWRVPLTEPIITDRPDFTESAVTVPRGHLQLETGYTGAYDREDGKRESAHSFPEALLSSTFANSCVSCRATQMIQQREA